MAGRVKLVGQIAAVAVVLGLLGLLAWKVAKNEGTDVPAAIRAGKSVAAPEFTLPRLDREGELSLASLRGRAVVVNFWASWCGPCEQEAPLLESLWRKHRSRGVVFVGIAARDFDGAARRFLREYGVTYPNVHDGRGRMWRPYGVKALPETFFVGRSGKLVGLIPGAIDDDELDEVDELIDTALVS